MVEPTPLAIPPRLIVSGARCTWWDTIDKAGKMPGPVGTHTMPCCPNCKSPLFQNEPAEWWRAVDQYEASGHFPGYRAFVEWMQGRCFPNLDAAKAAYTAEGH